MAQRHPESADAQLKLAGMRLMLGKDDQVREMLKGGQRPPNEFSRPEIADILIRWAQSAK